MLTKSVNSAFYGTPALGEWLDRGGVRQIVVAGIQTNMCAETTARMGGNLGYEVFFAPDATYTFGLVGPWGWRLDANELARSHRRALARWWLRGGRAQRGADRGGRAPVG